MALSVLNQVLSWIPGWSSSARGKAAPTPPVRELEPSAGLRRLRSEVGSVLRDIDKAAPPSTAGVALEQGAPLQMHEHTRLMPLSTLGPEAGAPVPAHWLGRGTLVMEAPKNRHAAPWAAACLAHDVRLVIDVGGPSSVDASHANCMKSTAPWQGRSARAQFECDTDAVRGFPIETAMPGWELPAVERRVAVRLSVSGHPEARSLHEQALGRAERHAVTARDAEGKPVTGWNQGLHRAPELRWLRVAQPAGEAVSPSLLLRTCRHVEKRMGEPGAQAGTVAFQSADGGRTAALFAAARDVHRTLLQGRIPPERSRDAVVEACARARAQLSHDLLQHPEDVAALLGMVNLMKAEWGAAGVGGATRPLRA